MSNPGMYLTADGKEILSKGLLGKEIHFSKVAFGAGDFDYSTESVSDLTALRDWKIDLPIVDKVLEGGMVKIIAALKNFTIEDGFPAKEIGVFALDPDTGAEKLYAYRNAGDEYNFIPGGGSVVKKDIQFGYWIEIQDAPNVTFNIDYSFAHVQTIDFDAHVNSETPHPNTPTHYDDVETTSNFWATDEDSDLHKISVDNVKKILLDEIEEKVSLETKKLSELQEFITAKAELGLLEPNILQIENFNPPTLMDDTKIKITSCAKGGNLLSAKSLDGAKIGAEYFLTDGTNCEQVKIINIQISNSKILINNSQYVLTLENNLVNSYNLEETFLLRSNISHGTNFVKCCAPLQSRKWKSRETFQGYPSNVPRETKLDFSCDNFAAFKTDSAANFSNDFFTM